MPDAASKPLKNTRQSQPRRSNSRSAPIYTAGASSKERAAVIRTMLRPKDAFDQSPRTARTPQDNPKKVKAANATNCQGVRARPQMPDLRIGDELKSIVALDTG